MDSTGRRLLVGVTLRYPQQTINNYPTLATTKYSDPSWCQHQNFYWLTYSPAAPAKPVKTDMGIWPVKPVAGPDGIDRIPVVPIRTSPSKAGTSGVPWKDEPNLATGYLHYFGDAAEKHRHLDPGHVRGNEELLAQEKLHRSRQRSSRLEAAPVLYFTGVAAEGRSKGHVRFDGLYILQASTPVTQVGQDGLPFSNFAFDLSVVRLDDDGLPWDWIAARRDPTATLEDALKLAPSAWQEWVETGEIGGGTNPDPHASPTDSHAVDDVGMEIALGLVRDAFPGDVVEPMAQNNPGFDFRVGPAESPTRYVELKSTRSHVAKFIISEGERRFSEAHPDQYSLLVLTGIDLETRTYQEAWWCDGEVGVDSHGLRPLKWQGRVDGGEAWRRKP